MILKSDFTPFYTICIYFRNVSIDPYISAPTQQYPNNDRNKTWERGLRPSCES